jgi:AmiR/NasT family two-component response regulator
MNDVLLIAAPGAPDIAADLAAQGLAVCATSDSARVVRDAAVRQPALVVAWDPHPAAALLAALADLHRHAPTPVLLFTSDADAETLDAALHSGVHAYVVNGYAPARLRALAQLARARFAQDEALRREHEALLRRYEERKLVDRAKGILMRTRRVDEDEAFRLLRGASMRRHERVGSVSQRLIDAARDAGNVNGAGLLRMLSQQLVKLHALRCAGLDTPLWRERAEAARERARVSIETLVRTLSGPTWGDLLGAVEQTWRNVDALLDAAPARAGLPALDAAAEALLQAAERLTAALESSSPLATLAVVNLAGRQRMLSQRLAKQALLGRLLDGAAAASAAADAVVSIGVLEEAQQRLSQAPLSSPEIRARLDEAQRLLQQQLAALRAPAADALGAMAEDSEALLGVFERLVTQYEQGVHALFAGG